VSLVAEKCFGTTRAKRNAIKNIFTFYENMKLAAYSSKKKQIWQPPGLI
jgi:hypothetical protein